MTSQRTTIASLVTLGLGALVTVAALLQAGGFAVLLSGFALLAIIPYVVFCGACFFARSHSVGAIATLVVCVLATVFAVFIYGDLIFIRPGSMSGLAFLLVPSFQLPAAVLLLVVMFFIRLPRRGSSTT